MKTHRNAPQGHASHHEVYRPNHGTRGPASPLGNPDVRPQERVVRRDEDYASAQMQFVKKGSIPEPNRAGGVTAVRGRHGPQMKEDVS